MPVQKSLETYWIHHVYIHIYIYIERERGGEKGRERGGRELYTNRSYGKEHSCCEIRLMNTNLGQQWASPDAGRKNLIGQQPGSTTATHLYGCCLLMREKNSPGKITMTLILNVCSNCITLRAGKQGARSVEVVTLAPVSEKSETELKTKPKLLRCKNIVNMTSFKVRNLNIVNESPEPTTSAVVHNIDIICIQEYWYYNSELEIKYHDNGNGWIFVSA